MSKSVLLSIKPKYCELIASGKKTIEVRKTRPKIDVPFKGYIYCTKPSKKHQTICGCMILNSDELYRHPKQGIKYGDSIELMCCNDEYSEDNFLNGKVIGEFICDRIIDIDCDSFAPFDKALDLYIDKQCCLTRDEFFAYTQGRCAFGFHISYLIIYDKPKDLDEFMAFGKSNCDCKNCDNCLYMGIDGVCDIKDIFQPLFRPPQSWCYVEELI